MKPPFGFTTQLLHSDRLGGVEHGAFHKPTHTSVAYGYEDVEDLIAVFQNRKAGYAYARQNNPTVAALEKKITLMEDGVASICFSTGMGAIAALVHTLIKKGEHIISSRFLFGNTVSLFSTFQDMGIEVTYVDATDLASVKKAFKPNTRMVFVETIANPATQIADLEGIGSFCQEKKLIYVVDNTLTSPYLFRPKKVGANISVNSLTKSIAGHGDALGGAVTDLGTFDWSVYPNINPLYRTGDATLWGMTQVRKKGLRDFGATLSPDAAHRISVGTETMSLRIERMTSNALALANYLEAHPKVSKVFYPGLKNHPQHERNQKLFAKSGALLSFVLKPEIDLIQFMNRLKLVISSTNLGDTRTLAIPVAPTIFHEIGIEGRKEMGIDESMIRVSVGIEDFVDLKNDFETAFQST
jgi:O-acetylhomoserine (thiol)-lyase